MKKTLLILSIFLCMILFTACKGSTITSTTKFHKDGSGIRTVSAFISKSDAKKMNLSFEDLDKMLEAVAPEAVNLSRTMNENNDATYEFSFSFSDIDDYNKKIEEITGEKHDAIWYSDPSIFKSDITFSESPCTYDLVKWAIKALESSGYSKLYSNLDLYEIGANKFYLDDKLMYEEKGRNDKPSFTVHTAQMLNNISVYTKYDMDNNLTKQLILEFDKSNFKNLNTELAKKLLDSYSKNFDIDLANGIISLKLDKEEDIKSFLEKADTNYRSDNLQYKVDNPTPFHLNFQFLENYNLSNFLNNFTMNTEYINNYLALPKDIKYQKRIFYSTNNLEEGKKEYDFLGKYKVFDQYQAEFSIDANLQVKEVKVLYGFDEKYVNTIQTTVTLSDSDYPVTLEELKSYYKDKADYVRVDKKKGNFLVTLINKYPLHSRNYKDSAKSSLKTKTNLFIKKVETYKSQYSLKDYIPIDIKDTNIKYELTYNPALDIEDFKLNNKKMDLSALKQRVDTAGNIHVTLDSGNNSDVVFYMNFIKRRPILPFLIIGFIIVIMTILTVITMKDLKKDEDSTVLDNWVIRIQFIANGFIEKIKK